MPKPAGRFVSALLGWFVFATGAIGVLRAQTATNTAPGEVASTGPAPGHSLHGEAFDEGPRRAATLLSGMPSVHFPITTSNVTAQAFFDQGIGQLHGFWYFEAERSFRQVALLDPRTPMAFWGMAMANVNNARRAREFIGRAVTLQTNANPRERRWIAALEGFYREKDGDRDRPETQRRRDYVRALESLVQDFPEDIEARAFLVYQVWDNAGFGNEKPLAITSHQAVDALLDGVFARSPNHPAHHYRIHLWDPEKPERALGSAALGGPSGPGIAHLWHMPGHTYDKLRRFDDAAWQQEASARVDHAHLRQTGILPDQIHNYAHNQEWLARSLNHLGRVEDALATARDLTDLPRHPKWNHLGKGGSSAAYGRLRLIQTLLRWELWDTVLAEADGGPLEATDHRDQRVLRHFAIGLASFMKGDTNRVGEQVAALENLRGEIGVDRVKAADEAEGKAKAEKKNRDQIGRAMADALLAFEKELVPVDDAVAELNGWMAAGRQEPETARECFERVKDMPGTRRAYAWLRAGNTERAEKAAREAAEKATNQLHELAVRCDVLWQVGKTNEAREAFAAVRAAAAHADRDLPIWRRLRPLADSLGLPEDWRPAPVSAPDRGARPDLDSLGPRFWEPREAPSWKFLDADRQEVTSSDFAGQPYLVLFYLGHGCSHCIEQLKAFGPAAPDFAREGIRLVAVSLDEPADLAWTGRRAGTNGAMAFPVVSDASRTGFRAFGAYDDFEDRPLHGTFLVDERGAIRWQDVGAEPFTDARFLLAEARRLLLLARSRPGARIAMRP